MCLLVTWRTWALAGIPLVGPQQIVDLLAKFGITRYATWDFSPAVRRSNGVTCRLC